MKSVRTILRLCLVLIFLHIIESCSLQNTTSFQAPLLENLGKYKVDITTQSAYAGRFFNQGLIMSNAFNHAEAARSFREAIRLDSTCAMAHWGLAYVLGPNYNTNSNQGALDEIRNAVQRAVSYSAEAKDWERALINAIAAKFPEVKNEADEEAYASIMRKAYEKFPSNDLVATLFAESIMNLHAWDLYTRKGGEPKPWTPELVAALENALTINPENPLANHLYIHAVEAAPDVEKALKSAERLKTLVPAAGHLVHMPSHIYINTGDYHEGSLVNEEAVVADSIYIAECKAQGVYPQLYYPHNYHFLAATAALEGRGARAIEAAFKTASIIDKNYLRQDGFAATTQHYTTISYNTLVKFAQWEKILTMPAPDDDLDYPNAIWHYARGMAFANTGKIEQANGELGILKELAETEALKSLMIWEINSASDIATIAMHVLAGELARLGGDHQKAEEHLVKAIEIEDQLNYNEPPDWFFSVRHILGDLYLQMNEFEKAETIYREDLRTWAKNGFALHGLFYSLEGQGRIEEAAKVKNEFEKAWQYADSKLKFSRIDEEQRQNLVLQIDEDTPNTLLYIAGTFCKPLN